MLLFNFNVATPSIFLFSNRECYADQKCSGFIFSILSIYRVINCEYICVLILIFARYQKFKIFKTRIKMFAEFDLIQINYEVLWREAIVESAATNNSYMVVFDNSNPTIVPRTLN